MDCVATHRVRSVDAMKLEVQAACVAHHLAAQVTTPDRCRGRSAIGARQILLRALLIIVGVLRAVVIVVVAFRQIIRAGPQMIAGCVGHLAGSGCVRRRSAHDLLAGGVLQARATWARLFSTTGLLLSVLKKRKIE